MSFFHAPHSTIISLANEPNTFNPVGTFQIYHYSVKVKDFIADFKAKITADPWFELKGPALSPEEIAAQLAQETVCPPDEIVRTYHQGPSPFNADAVPQRPRLLPSKEVKL